MDFGASMFMTDYAIGAAELARALEERGFESLWNPEHSHIPLSRKTPFPGGSELPKMYYDAMDPFVTLSVAAAVTTRLKVGTGVCLVIQRDTIQTAKLVASIDQAYKKTFSVRHRRRLEPGRNGGSRHGLRDALQADARADRGNQEYLDRQQARIHGDIVDFPPMMTWPKPVQKPHPPVIVGGAFPHAARRAVRYGNGWVPIAGRGPYGQIENFLPPFKEMLSEAGRSLADVPITMFGAPQDPDQLKRWRDIGVSQSLRAVRPNLPTRRCRCSTNGPTSSGR